MVLPARSVDGFRIDELIHFNPGRDTVIFVWSGRLIWSFVITGGSPGVLRPRTAFHDQSSPSAAVAAIPGPSGGYPLATRRRYGSYFRP